MNYYLAVAQPHAAATGLGQRDVGHRDVEQDQENADARDRQYDTAPGATPPDEATRARAFDLMLRRSHLDTSIQPEVSLP